MRALLGALRLPHWIGLGLVVAVIGSGLPSNWYGLVGSKVSEVEHLRACLLKHRVELASLVTSLGDPQSLLDAPPAVRKHLLHTAEKRGDLKRRQANAVVACAHTVVAH